MARVERSKQQAEVAMPDIFMHFIFRRWLSHKTPAPKPEVEAAVAAPAQPKEKRT